MNSEIPKWVRDLQAQAEAVAFGDVKAVSIKRHRSKISNVTIEKVVNLRPKTPEEGINDLQTFINSFMLDGFDGRVEFAVDFKSGTIQMIAIKNKETKNYGSSSN